MSAARTLLNRMPRPTPVKPASNQESVWDYPRPPRLERTTKTLRVDFAGEVLAQSARAWRVLETSHPPVYYIPREDVDMDLLTPSAGSTNCEWKGAAQYFDAVVGERRAEQCAWTYPRPVKAFEPIAGHFAFYAARVDACYVDGILVEAQPGNFYGGWITPDVVGPFKGGPGSWGW